MHRQEDWKFKVKHREVTVRVALDGIGREGQGTIVGFHVMYGPSRLGLDVPVDSKEDAAAKIQALLFRLLGEHWQ